MSLLNDPRGYLGTDTGGKVATLEVMTARHRLDPDVGYWAERWDPAGRLHPLYYTTHPNHRWVNVTTLPMLYAAYPLYLAGGYRLTLLLPMLGSVLTALAARALARRVGGGDGWGAFWIVGLASPITIYALDFWEHSLGVAAMVWATVLLLDVVEGRRGWPFALAAGGLFGVAATLRNEAFVYGFVAVGLACIVLLARRRAAFSVVSGALAAAGLCVPLLLNAAVEQATMGDPARLDRATSTASAAGALAGRRVEEALLNAAAITPLQETGSYLVGAVLVLLLAFFAVRASKPGGDAGPLLAVVGILVLYVLRFDLGLGFVPSLVAATPLAVVGLALGWSSPAARYLLATGLAALPLVWATQFQGGAAAQWGGRYLLVSGLLFGVVGAVALARLRPWARTAAVGLAVVVTTFGLIWTSTRTHDIADAGAALVHRPEPVLVSRIGHLAREDGAFYRDHRWLTAPSDADQAFAVGVLERAGITRFGLVDLEINGEHAAPPGWRKVGQDSVRYLSGFNLSVTTFQMA